MSDAHVHVVNGPTDMDADELAERKRLAAVDYHKAELNKLEEALKKMVAKKAAAAKVDNQRKMIAAEKAALAAVKGV